MTCRRQPDAAPAGLRAHETHPQPGIISRMDHTAHLTQIIRSARVSSTFTMRPLPCNKAGLHAFSLGFPSLSVTLPSCTLRLTFQCGVTGLPGSLQVAGIGSPGQWGAPPGTRTRTRGLRADRHKKQYPYRHKLAILPAHRPSWVTYSQVRYLCPFGNRRRQTPNFPALAQEKPRSTVVTEFPARTPQKDHEQVDKTDQDERRA